MLTTESWAWEHIIQNSNSVIFYCCGWQLFKICAKIDTVYFALDEYSIKWISSKNITPHLLHGAIKPGFEFPLEIFHTKAPVGLNNA